VGLNGTTPDTDNRLYYFLNTPSITSWKAQSRFKLNSDAIKYQEIGRPILGNYTAPTGGGVSNGGSKSQFMQPIGIKGVSQ